MTTKKRVLIMEDNHDLAVEWRDAFELNQYSVALSSNGDEAAKYLASEKFDLVITDIFVKNGKGGLFLLTQLLKMGADAPPAIAVTGAFAHSNSSEEQNLFLEQAGRLGASANISKPFLPMELLLLADSLLA